MTQAARVRCVLCKSERTEPVFTNYHHCLDCDLRWLDPLFRLPPEQEKAEYEKHNNDVDDPRYQKFVEPLVLQVKQHKAPGAKGLDFGAGTGPVLAKMLRNAGYDTRLYDLYFWNEPSALNENYDFICMSEVAEHFYNPADEFARLAKMLKPGGVLTLMTLLYEPAIDFQTWFYRRDPTHVVFYSRATFEWIATRFGYEKLHFTGNRVITLFRPIVS